MSCSHRDPSLKCSCILTSWGSGLQHRSFGDIVQLLISHSTLGDPKPQAHTKAPCFYCPVPSLSHSDAFAKLLESGDLSMSSIKVDGISMSFQNLLAKICFHHRFSGKGLDMADRWLCFSTHVTPPHPRAGPASPLALCCSCGTSGFLRLHVQPLHPGTPRLPPGEEGEPSGRSHPAFPLLSTVPLQL